MIWLRRCVSVEFESAKQTWQDDFGNWLVLPKFVLPFVFYGFFDLAF
jgi:hypothetical protein